MIEEWDPIGVRDLPGAASEYDRYGRLIGPMLFEDVEAGELEEYLCRVRTDYMRISPGVTGAHEPEAVQRDRIAAHALLRSHREACNG